MGKVSYGKELRAFFSLFPGMFRFLGRENKSFQKGRIKLEDFHITVRGHDPGGYSFII
jgi:hypothetical protein